MIEFKDITYSGPLKRECPPGHYLNKRDDCAQIIAVDCFRDVEDYRDAIPGMSVIGVEPLPVVNHPEEEGRFMSIWLVRMSGQP